jgi:hypothetical protein
VSTAAAAAAAVRLSTTGKKKVSILFLSICVCSRGDAVSNSLRKVLRKEEEHQESSGRRFVWRRSSRRHSLW